MKKITLEEHFLSPAYAQHVRDLQREAAGAGVPSEFEALLDDPVMRKGIEVVEAKLLDVGEGRLAAYDTSCVTEPLGKEGHRDDDNCTEF